MSARTVEHWWHDHYPARRDVYLRTNGHIWRVEISVGPLSGPRKHWDCDTEDEARELMVDLKNAGGDPRWWRSIPVGGRG